MQIWSILRISNCDLSCKARFKSDASGGGRQSGERCEVFSEEMSSRLVLRVTQQSWPRWKGQTIIWESGGRGVKTERGQNQLAAGKADWGNAHRHIMYYITIFIMIPRYTVLALRQWNIKAAISHLSSFFKLEDENKKKNNFRRALLLSQGKCKTT